MSIRTPAADSHLAALAGYHRANVMLTQIAQRLEGAPVFGAALPA
jgi:hypothetical protein